jgi:MFS family permease
LFSLIFLLPVFLQNLRGFRAFDSGLMTLPGAVGSMITMPLAGIIYDRIGPRAPAVCGLIVTGICSLWLQVLDVTTPDDLLRWIIFFRGMGMGLAMMPIMTYALSSVSQRMTSQASALLNVCRTIFGSMGIAVFATLLDGFTKTNMAHMVQTVTPDSVIALRVLSQMQVYLMQMGLTLDAARQEAVVLLYQFVSLRAAVTAFDMNYVIGAVIVLLGVIPAMFLPFGRIKKGETVVDMGA